ncbi:right-handed parallel beta-helix repeat-containing protein [Herbiconiux sp. UC225_62]|uniref:right-handed parallel beta-helix repeat-containing protein n=1 Tax=Herbiconiux sp. UC225_62 TaxID=3350168 RepID=UPI0036D404E7
MRRVWGAPVDNDGNDPFAVYSDGRTFLDPHETVTIERKLHDVRRYLDLGADEQLPNDGILDAQPLIQRAVTALHAMYLIDGIPRQVYLPLGRWRLNTDINWYGCSGIGLVGAGRTSTTLLPYGPNPAIRGVLTSGYDGPDYYDCVFEDFTIDCANQTADPSGDSTKVKGIFIQRMIRAWFARVTILHSGATSFGVDFLKQSYFTDCYAIDAGRFITDRKSTGAGFGFATGLWEDESISLVNCISLNCHSHGIFVEKSTSRLSAYPEKPGGYKPIGLRVVNHYAAGCYDGFFASGATAPLLLNCVFAYNDFAGVLIDENTLTLDGDDITQIRGCLIYKNGNGIDPNTSAKFINSGGVVLRKTTGLSPKIEENVILENYGPGVRVYGSSAGPALAIRGNQILRNQESGILISSGTGPKRTVIEGNQIFDNGTNASATYRDGITFVNTILDHLVMVHNNVWDTRAAGSKTQQNGVQTTGTPLWTKPRVQDNNFDENAVASMGLSSNQSVTTFVTGNMV